MLALGQRLRSSVPAAAAILASVRGVHLDYCPTGPLSLVRQVLDKLPPASISYGPVEARLLPQATAWALGRTLGRSTEVGYLESLDSNGGVGSRYSSRSLA